MGPKKGLSFDEKRERLLELFTETAEFYTLKELEKLAFKRKGIGMFICLFYGSAPAFHSLLAAPHDPDPLSLLTISPTLF